MALLVRTKRGPLRPIWYPLAGCTWLQFTVLLILSETQNWACSAEVYSSASDMKEVFRLERELVSIMDGFASKLQSKLNKINSYLEEFDEVMKERRQSPSEEDLMEKIATNPIHAY